MTKPELAAASVVILTGLGAASLKFINWRLAIARREDLQRELREAATRLANAKNEAEREAEKAIIEDIERRMAECGMHPATDNS